MTSIWRVFVGQLGHAFNIPIIWLPKNKLFNQSNVMKINPVVTRLLNQNARIVVLNIQFTKKVCEK